MTEVFDTAGTSSSAIEPQRPGVALVDLLDRVLAGGVVVTGEVTLSVAEVDLVHISLRLLLSSVGTLAESMADAQTRGEVL